MKNKFLSLIAISMSIPLLAGCKNGTSSVSSIEEIPPDNFEEVLNNTTNYNLCFSYSSGFKYYYELNGSDYYCYTPNKYGYAVLDTDPDFTHFFTLSITTIGTGNGFALEMNGRNTSSELFRQAVRNDNSTFIDLLGYLSDFFTKDKNNPWKYVSWGYSCSSAFKDFFRMNEFSYCDYYEINVGKNGRIESFKAGETYDKREGSDYDITETILLEEPEFSNVYFYDNWVKSGSPIVERVMDYKTFYQKNGQYHSCYDEGNIDAVVTSLDYDGSFYISNKNTINGAIGMRVTPKEAVSVAVGDKVNVRGKIKMDLSGLYTASPRFIDAQVTILNHNNPIPLFDEESIVDSYGGGVLATNTLVQSPIFSDSLYTTFGYATNVPAQANAKSDTIVKFIFPSFHYEKDKSFFNMELHIPRSYGEENINKILDECRNSGDYYADKDNAKMIMLKNVISRYSFTRQLSLDLYVMPNSLISHRLNYVETIENDYGYKDFPELKGKEANGLFHFGDNSGWLIEDQYLLEVDEHVDGVFSFHRGATLQDINDYFDALIAYGAEEYDYYSLYMTIYSQHYVYKYNDLYIDVMFENFAGVISEVQIFVYRSPKVIRCKTIEEKIDEACGSYFKGEEFIRLPGTHNTDYHFYEVPSFAGNEFGMETPLYVATVDLLGDRYEELRKAYRDAGWKQYRNSDNTAYSYMTRGVSRIVYYKENENGKKTFLDFGSYPVTDYTFLRCEVFDPRIEIAIYEGDRPLQAVFTQDLNAFVKDSVTYAPSCYFDWKLPSKYKAEYYSHYLDLTEYDFGYCYNKTNVFIYPEIRSPEELDELYEYCVNTVLDHGYQLAFEGKQGNNYKIDDPNSDALYHSSYIYIQKNYAKGYVRMISAMGGLDF